MLYRTRPRVSQGAIIILISLHYAKYLSVPFAISDRGGRNKLYSLDLDGKGDTVLSWPDGQGKD